MTNGVFSFIIRVKFYKKEILILKRFLSWLLSIFTCIIVLVLVIEFCYLPDYFLNDQPLTLEEQESDGDMVVMSANVRFINPLDLFTKSWFFRAKLLRDDLQLVTPDIVGFQEVTPVHYEYLKKILPDYDSTICYRDDFILSEGCPIFYRTDKYEMLDGGSFWLSETPDKPSHGWDAMCRRVTVWGLFRDKKTGDEFYFFDTHFDHIGSNARRHEAVMITDYMKKIAGEKKPVIVCGDFNTTVGHEALAPIRSWMQDARSTAAVSDKLASFNDWGARELWIDHIFYRRCKILGYKTIVNDKEHYGVPYLSDHNPIVGYFKL